MWRFFRSDGKALIMALDIGGQGKADFNPADIIPQAVEGGIDGILTTYGVIKNFRKEIGKIGIMLRMDATPTDITGFDSYPQLRKSKVKDALRLGVDGMMCMGYPGKELNGVSIDLPSMQNIAKLAAVCDRWGLVSAAEILPYGFSSDPAHRTIDLMKIAARVGAEQGLDFIKTAYVGPAAEFKKVVDNSYAPILVLGGPFNSDAKVMLEYVRGAMDAGCRGVVMGRNIFKNENIPGFVSAVTKIIHQDETVENAMKELK
jgi:class I fructose-bisphosphate aldolase